jgi:hypothetical protein
MTEDSILLKPVKKDLGDVFWYIDKDMKRMLSPACCLPAYKLKKAFLVLFPGTL